MDVDTTVRALAGQVSDAAADLGGQVADGRDGAWF